MEWTPEAVIALRTSRRESQSEFAKALGVGRDTVSLWENGKASISALNAAALSRMAGAPRDTSRDYQRGVLYACEAMSETVARLLREQREADEGIIKQTASAMLAVPAPATGSAHPETNATDRRTGRPSHTGRGK